MKITDAKFITSAADRSGFYKTDKPVVCVCGRSNVGKSSFINTLANRKKLARTSSEPGRTRLVNYFDFGAFVLADLPGYGYARVSKTEKARWAKTLEDFFASADIKHVFALVDIRHEPTEDDRDMITYLYANAIPFTLVATKADKLPKTRIKPQAAKVAQSLALGTADIIATSAVTGLGKDLILDKLDDVLRINAECETKEDD